MAHTCVRGADLMYKYAEEHNLPVERCGKLIVAKNEKEHAKVQMLYDQGVANGVKGLEIVYRDQVKKKKCGWESPEMTFCLPSSSS
jgi:2-hydroxyglutarate dehydrogenase